MNDTELSELRLRATIVPQQARWPAPEYLHWQKLHAVPDEARGRVSKAYALMDEIDRNADLSPEGKDRQRRQVAARGERAGLAKGPDGTWRDPSMVEAA